ncbi:hypothetical protein DPMN_115118 [Dreissena polymorpha]|uniref:Uncharacterized protein n=1 Tax=Dreissena polymorpha TaxID=45954 RepID=A0A9D4KLA7_DREPO|nr:hypothetical protein DPMN_115118 [Dreissena polymorpha]
MTTVRQYDGGSAIVRWRQCDNAIVRYYDGDNAMTTVRQCDGDDAMRQCDSTIAKMR